MNKLLEHHKYVAERIILTSEYDHKHMINYLANGLTGMSKQEAEQFIDEIEAKKEK